MTHIENKSKIKNTVLFHSCELEGSVIKTNMYIYRYIDTYKAS